MGIHHVSPQKFWQFGIRIGRQWLKRTVTIAQISADPFQNRGSFLATYEAFMVGLSWEGGGASCQDVVC